MPKPPIPLDLGHALALDQRDELAHLRSQFIIDDPDLIYLDGNSLGRLPKRTPAHLQHHIRQQWGHQLIRSWNQDWLDLSRYIGDKIGQLLGARPGEVLVADSTSVNLYKLAVAALNARPDRSNIITDDLNFPSDLYILQSAITATGNRHHLQVIPSPDGITLPIEILEASINNQTALVSLSHVAFKSGYLHDLPAITQLAHRHGALTLWDLSHSAGAVPIDLTASGVDLAVGCTYKYLNGGPGAPAFLCVRQDLQAQLSNPIAGWFGQQQMFDFALDYTPAPGIRRFLTGTPPLLSLAAIEPGIDLLLEAGIDRLRAKSVQQTDYLIALWEAVLQPLGFWLNSPRDPARRGSHVSLGHTDGLSIDLALIHEMNVLPDFRPPDNLRLGIAPIYTSFADIYRAVMHIREVMVEGHYRRYTGGVPAVT